MKTFLIIVSVSVLVAGSFMASASATPHYAATVAIFADATATSFTTGPLEQSLLVVFGQPDEMALAFSQAVNDLVDFQLPATSVLSPFQAIASADLQVAVLEDMSFDMVTEERLAGQFQALELGGMVTVNTGDLLVFTTAFDPRLWTIRVEISKAVIAQSAGTSAAMPEPSTLLLLGCGLMGVLGWRQWRTRHAHGPEIRARTP